MSGLHKRIGASIEWVGKELPVVVSVTFWLNGTQLGWDTGLSGADVGEQEAERDEERVQEGADQASIDTVDVEEDDVVDFEERRQDPDDGDVDDGEDHGLEWFDYYGEDLGLWFDYEPDD